MIGYIVAITAIFVFYIKWKIDNYSSLSEDENDDEEMKNTINNLKSALKINNHD